jgi:glycerol-3-phosphate O-acyltransferase
VENFYWTYPKVEEYLKEDPNNRKLLEVVFKEIHGEFREPLVKKAIMVLDSTFRKLYDSINLEVPFDFDLVELKKKYNILLVPNHQSHADYIALTYMFYKRFKLPVYIAGGINLNMFLIGKFFRNTGAFFIRRKFGEDIAYKVGFEAYIYALLRSERIVEFFFEGGRSRTGKLLRPRFGLFQMLLEAQEYIENPKELLFIPVSISHEHVPEEKAHARELDGQKKKKEKATQVFGLYKLFSKKLGSIHIKMGEGIPADTIKGIDIREKTQNLAFKCFRRIGRGMPVTPTALLALILLDMPSGASTWDDIEKHAKNILDFCKRFSIPLTPSLKDPWSVSKLSLNKALNLLVRNKKVDIIQSENLGDVYYSIKPDVRVNLLYFKNMILHHFLVPNIIAGVLYRLKKNSFLSKSDLLKSLVKSRDYLKFEFYLPKKDEMFSQALDVVNFATGKNVENIEECLGLTAEELDQISQKVFPFASALSYIYEGYYLVALALLHLAEQRFTLKRLERVYKEFFGLELAHGKVIKYTESFSIALEKTALDFFLYKKVIAVTGELYEVLDKSSLEKHKDSFSEKLFLASMINLY